MVKNLPTVQKTSVQSLGWEDPLEKEWLPTPVFLCFPGGSDSKESTCSAEDLNSIHGLGRSPGEENSYPLQYSCLENSLDGGAWQVIVHGVTESDMTE